MAQLNPDSEAQILSASAALLTLEVGYRFERHRKKYGSDPDETASTEQLEKLIDQLNTLAYSLHNLLGESLYAFPFVMVLAQKISDRLDELHDRLLNFDPDDIYKIIPRLDEERTFWRYARNDQYSINELEYHLEHRFPAFLNHFREFIIGLQAG